MSSALAVQRLRPGFHLNPYPERKETDDGAVYRRLRAAACSLRARSVRNRALRLGQRVAERVETVVRPLSYGQIIGLRRMLQEEGWSETCLEEALAVIGQQVKAHFGFDLHASQYAGAWAMLQGTLIEMATGEGKTITAAVAAIVAGLSGARVHIITTNDYLVERDAQSMLELYESFDLSCGHAIQTMDDADRRRAYASDVCYVANKLVVFDYLRDRQILGRDPATLTARLRDLNAPSATPPLLSGLSFAIVDEADSALIDDAITPLILSYQGDPEDEMAQSVTALSLAQRLDERVDFKVNLIARNVRLTAAGESHLESIALGLEGVWSNRRYCIERVTQALAALYVFTRDIDYLVRDDKVVLIDQSTGRVMPDRKMQNGQHQMLESKEKCELSGRSQTIASLSFQKFFTRYTLLAGMSGTATEASSELATTYQLGVVPIPTHRPVERAFTGAQFAQSDEFYFELLARAVRARIAQGQPVLVGTRSLAHSEAISNYLTEQGIDHSVLNARQDADEANLVAQAGRAAQVTIATNMAGRGTDIKICPQVRKSGGLHVIVSQLNDSVRIDRQLIGRCSRQGDPGSYEYIISPRDNVWNRQASDGERLKASDALLARSAWGCRRLFGQAQRRQHRIDKEQRDLRRHVAKADERMQRSLAFTGYKE